MSHFWDLFTKYVGTSFGKQLALADYLGERDWELDPVEGLIDFGDKGTFPIQILGSESEIDWTWLWAWANDELVGQVKDKNLDAANRMHSYGETHEIPEFVVAELDLDDVDGHSLALVCSALCKADGYYRAPYDDGAGFFLIYDTPLEDVPTPTMQMNTIITQSISMWPIEHRPMIEAYLEQEGFEWSEAKTTLHASAPDGRQMDVIFDDQGRLKTIHTKG